MQQQHAFGPGISRLNGRRCSKQDCGRQANDSQRRKRREWQGYSRAHRRSTPGDWSPTKSILVPEASNLQRDNPRSSLAFTAGRQDVFFTI